LWLHELIENKENIFTFNLPRFSSSAQVLLFVCCYAAAAANDTYFSQQASQLASQPASERKEIKEVNIPI